MLKHLTTQERRILANRSAAKRKNPEKIRLSVFRSGRHIEIQAIDDMAGRTLCAASSKEKDFGAKGWNVAGAEKVGATFAERAKKAKLTDSCYFDRGGYRYHGRVKALCEAIRKGGVKI
jgi:large subunit ribosomal protein L18